MPPRGARGGTGYTFDVLDLTTRSASNKVFELHAKAGGRAIGIVKWSPPDRAYVFCPDGNIMTLTRHDLSALHEFVSKQNDKEAARRMAITT